MKTCTKCLSIKSLSEYYKDSKSKDGLNFACKDCCKKLNAESYARNPEKVKQQVAAYRLANPQRTKALKRQDYDRNKEIYKARKEAAHRANPEIRKAKHRARYAREQEKILAQGKEYYARNAERLRASTIQYQKDNREKYNAYQGAYRRKKAAKDPVYALEVLCRSRVLVALRVGGFRRGTKTATMLGCTYQELKDYLEARFAPGMTWENRGKDGWHIDHIVPLASAKTEEELTALCHFSNLQPLWAADNYAKGARMPHEPRIDHGRYDFLQAERR